MVRTGATLTVVARLPTLYCAWKGGESGRRGTKIVISLTKKLSESNQSQALVGWHLIPTAFSGTHEHKTEPTQQNEI